MGEGEGRARPPPSPINGFRHSRRKPGGSHSALAHGCQEASLIPGCGGRFPLPRDGRIIESLGTYDPGTDPPSASIDPERARYWLSCGARPSDTVRTLFKKAGVYHAESLADSAPGGGA